MVVEKLDHVLAALQISLTTDSSANKSQKVDRAGGVGYSITFNTGGGGPCQ